MEITNLSLLTSKHWQIKHIPNIIDHHKYLSISWLCLYYPIFYAKSWTVLLPRQFCFIYCFFFLLHHRYTSMELELELMELYDDSHSCTVGGGMHLNVVCNPPKTERRRRTTQAELFSTSRCFHTDQPNSQTWHPARVQCGKVSCFCVIYFISADSYHSGKAFTKMNTCLLFQAYLLVSCFC